MDNLEQKRARAVRRAWMSVMGLSPEEIKDGCNDILELNEELDNLVSAYRLLEITPKQIELQKWAKDYVSQKTSTSQSEQSG